MSWNIDIKSDESFSESQVDAVVATMPKWMTSKLGVVDGSKQERGWSLAVDVQKPNAWLSKIILCSGSCSISGYIAEDFCKYFAKQLASLLGCRVVTGSMHI